MVQLYDQAEGLRRALVGDYVRTLLVAGTQYQIEKSGFIFNFVRSLVANGYQVLVIDLSQERKPLSEIFGIYPRYDLLHLVEGKALLDEVLYPIETGALLLQASRGLDRLAHFPPLKHQEWINLLKAALKGVDFVLAYTGLRSSDAAFRAVDACQDCLLLSETTKTSITAAYSWLKSTQYIRRNYWVYLIEGSSYQESKKVFENMALAARNFIDAKLDFAGVSLGADGVDSLVSLISRWPCPKEAAVSFPAFLHRLCLPKMDTRVVS